MLEVVRVGTGLSLADAVERLAGDAAVHFAEPNWIYAPDAVSDDPYYTSEALWGMYGAGGLGSKAVLQAARL